MRCARDMVRADDLGPHACRLACYVSGLEASEIHAEPTAFGEGRVRDDNAQILLRNKSAARRGPARWCRAMKAHYGCGCGPPGADWIGRRPIATGGCGRRWANAAAL